MWDRFVEWLSADWWNGVGVIVGVVIGWVGGDWWRRWRDDGHWLRKFVDGRVSKWMKRHTATNAEIEAMFDEDQKRSNVGSR